MLYEIITTRSSGLIQYAQRHSSFVYMSSRDLYREVYAAFVILNRECPANVQYITNVCDIPRYIRNIGFVPEFRYAEPRYISGYTIYKLTYDYAFYRHSRVRSALIQYRNSQMNMQAQEEVIYNLEGNLISSITPNLGNLLKPNISAWSSPVNSIGRDYIYVACLD